MEGLRVESLTVRYGGLVAVDSVSLEAPLGQLTALIGPNGAGKTTTFNACTGLVRPSEGRVHLLGKEVTGRSPAGRARAGLGRTFQRMQLCETLTVRDNVALGKEALLAGANPLKHLRGSAFERRQAVEEAECSLDRCGMGAFLESFPAELSTGQRRLVELARVIAGGFRVLLLDEPSSGLDRLETLRFGEILQGLVEDGDRAILMVEHDMSLVMAICHRLTMLDFGKPLFEGTPAEASCSAIVRSAYLGTHEVESAPALEKVS